MDFKAAALYYADAAQLDPNNTDYINMAGRSVDVLGKYVEAITYYERALAIDTKVYGKDHPSVARDLNNLGSSWHALGEHKKAIDYYERAKDIFLKKLGRNHPYTQTLEENIKAAEEKMRSRQGK